MKKKRMQKVIAVCLVLVSMFVCSMSVSAADMNYPDVKPGDWHYSYVQYVTENGIMTGYSNGYFGPADAVTRGQFATILYRLEGSPETAYKGQFPDVADGQYYSIPAVWANDAGIITGYTSNGCFGPNDNVTREQIATILYRYSGAKGYDTSIKDTLSGYPDAGRVSAFAEDAVHWAVGVGLITGDQGKINPQGTAERAQCAAILQRYQQYVDTQKEPVHEHTWVAQTETIPHEATGHYEERVVQKAWDEPVYEYHTVCTCGYDFTVNGGEQIEYHLAELGHSYGTQPVQTGTIHHDAVTESVWVQDSAAWDETITTGYVCSECGATK